MFKLFFKFIKENILGIKPIFIMKLEPMRFFNSYYLKFSNNNGWSWEYIKKAHDEYTYVYPRKIINIAVINSDSVKEFTSQFKTYEDCRRYNDKIRNEVEKFNEKSYLEYIEKEDKTQNFIENFNKGKYVEF